MSRRDKDEPRRVKRKAPKRPPAVLVFGEDDHDRECIKILLEALRPDLARRIQTRRSALQGLTIPRSASPDVR